MYRQKEVAERGLHRVNHFINSKTSKTPSRGDKTIFFLKQGNKTQNLGWWIWGCKERSYSYSSTSERSFHFYSDFCALRLTICCTDNIIIFYLVFTRKYRATVHSNPHNVFQKNIRRKKNSSRNESCVTGEHLEPISPGDNRFPSRGIISGFAGHQC